MHGGRLSSAEWWRSIVRPGRLTALCWLACALVGLLHAGAAAASQSMNPDGISYLDVGEAILAGDWTLGLNAYWSPLYALLLGLAVDVVQPGPRWEFVVVQAANFAIYLLALSAFAFFWNELLRRHTGGGRGRRGHPGSDGSAPWPWIVAGYALFLWSAIYLVELWSVTPDMLVAACVYLAVGLLLRIRRAPSGRDFALLGAVVGLGYLAKTAFLPVGLTFLVAAWLLARRRARRWPRAAALAAGGFLVVAGPFALALSAEKGRPTLGDSGRLNYAWYVNGVPQLHWRGDGASEGTALHPTRILLDSPRIYEFDGPVAGTYPPWSDPSYWYEGLEVRFRLGDQLEALAAGGLPYFRWGFGFLGGVLFVLAAAWLVSRGGRTRRDDRSWLLGVPVVVGLSMYALVYVEGRYVGPYVVLGLAALAAPLLDRDLSRDGRLAAAAGIAMSLVLLLNIVSFNLAGLEALAFGGSIGEETADPPPTHAGGEGLHASGPAWLVAEELRARGVGPGEGVAYIGHTIEESGWARLARLRIVAEMYPWDAPGFWYDSLAQSRAVEAMRTTRAAAVVTGAAPFDASLGPGWEALGDTGFHFLTLRAGGDPPEDR